MAAYLQTLGVTCIRSSDTPIVLSAREAAVLAYLCYRHRIQTTRTELADIIWPGTNERKARHSLSQLIYEIRARMGEDLILTSDDVISATNLQADFVELLSCARRNDTARVLALYEGRFLSKDYSYSDRLREWRDTVEHDVAHAVANALREESCIVGSAELPRVVSVAEQVLAVHPHLVPAQLGILEALVRMGDVSEAERLHKEFRHADSLGSVPLPPIESFIPRLPPAVQSGYIGFVGRETEVGVLEKCWEEVTAGTGNFAVISGEPGIGKTRLADHLLRRIAIRGGATWLVRCCAATQRLPYSAVSELVRDNANPTLTDVESFLRQYLDSPQMNPALGTDEYRHQLTESLTSLVITRCQEQPLAILIDDAQWADDYTALLLSYWSYRLKGHKVLVVLTVRTEEAEDPPDWINSDLGKVLRVALGRISIEAASSIVEAFESRHQFALDGELRNAVIWHSAGRPFLLIEALTHVMSTQGSTTPTAQAILSETAESVLSRRFRDLPSEAASTLAALAVWGHDIRTDSLARVAGVTHDDLVKGLDLLHRRGVAYWEAGRVAFPHDLMREAAHRNLLPATRAFYHMKAAAELERTAGPAGLIAQHFASAGDADKATIYATRAATEAFSAHLYADYEFYSRMCIVHGRTPDQTRAAENLGRYLMQVGRSDEIGTIAPFLVGSEGETSLISRISEFEQRLAAGTAQAAELLEHSRHIVSTQADFSDASAAPIIATLLDVALDAGSHEFGEQIAITLLADSERGHSSEARIIIQSIIAVWHGMTKSTTEALLQVESALSGVEASTSPPVRALCLASYGTLLLLVGKVQDAGSYFASALSLAAACGDHRRQWAILNNNGVAILESGDHQGARQHWARVVTAPNVHCRIRGYGNLAISHYEDNDPLNAKSAAEAVLSMNEVYRSPIMGSVAHGILGLCALDSNDERSAGEHDTRIEALLRQGLRDRSESGYACALHTRLLSRRGCIAEAVQVIDKAIDENRPRDVLSALRLSCEKAMLMSTLNTDLAYRVAKDVADESQLLGANLIHGRAQTILAGLRHA